VTWLFLALLGVAWVGITLPAALRARRRTPLPSAEGFRRKQASLSARSAPGRWVLVPQSPDGRVEAVRHRTRAHRRRLFVALLWACVLSAAIAAVRGGALWEVHVALDACLGIYVALLIDAKKRRSQPSKKVSQLHQRRRQASPPPEERVLEQAVGYFGGRRG
jgi:uncharacterized membrane protein